MDRNPDLALVDRMETGARSLKNGKKGDIHALCDVISDTALVVGSIARHGCNRPCNTVSWPGSVAIIASVVAVIAGLVGLVKLAS